MTTYDTLEALGSVIREAVVGLLYRLADDELIIGHRHSEWVERAPSLDEGVALSSIAQEEKDHAHAYYEMLHALGEPGPDTLAFARKPRAFRCASLVSLPDSGDWTFCVLRQFLYDAAETVRITALVDSSLTPLAQLAAKLRKEEKRHLTHGRAWVLRLCRAAGEDRDRTRSALDQLYPHALGLFEPTDGDEPLAQAGICPDEPEFQRQWESAVAPVLAESGLTAPEAAVPVYGGRVGRHPEALAKLLGEPRHVHSADPSAKR